MTREDRRRWNERYRGREYDFTPNSWLVELAERLRPARPAARALDVACGVGRDALFLAELGYTVDAWDVSDEGLAILAAELERRGGPRALAVRPRRVDLDRAAIPAARYNLVVDLFFLDRRLFPRLAAALRPGGLLVIETFVDVENGGRANVRPEYKLRPGELPAVFAGLEILEYAEVVQTGTARLLARRRA